MKKLKKVSDQKYWNWYNKLKNIYTIENSSLFNSEKLLNELHYVLQLMLNNKNNLTLYQLQQHIYPILTTLKKLLFRKDFYNTIEDILLEMDALLDYKYNSFY